MSNTTTNPILKLNVNRPYGEPGTYIEDEHTALVAKLYDGQEHYAPLFAAAPELLAALKDAQQALAHAIYRLKDDPSFATSIALKGAESRAIAAIAKATNS